MAKEAGRAKSNGLEQTLWLAADKLQKNIGTAFNNND
jgi:hypothetical protein